MCTETTEFTTASRSAFKRMHPKPNTVLLRTPTLTAVLEILPGFALRIIDEDTLSFLCNTMSIPTYPECDTYTANHQNVVLSKVNNQEYFIIPEVTTDPETLVSVIVVDDAYFTATLNDDSTYEFTFKEK